MPQMHEKEAYPRDQVTLLPQGNYLLSCMTTIRNSDTESAAFASAFEKVANQLLVAGMSIATAVRSHR